MYLRQLFRILFRTLNHQYDYSFDWTLLKQKAASHASVSSLTAPGHATTGAVSPAAGKRLLEKEKDKKEKESTVRKLDAADKKEKEIAARKLEASKRGGEFEHSAVGVRRPEDSAVMKRPPELSARGRDGDRKH